jgi:hypothetical protein
MEYAMNIYNTVTFLHVLAVVFMSAPLYNLIVVNERLRFGKAPYAVDRYFENLIKTNAVRCFAFQATALVTGVLLVVLADLPLTELFTNRVLLAKVVLLLTLTVLLSYVHFGIQPRIEALLEQVRSEEIPPSITEQLGPWRKRRKKPAGICLFFVIVLVLLGLQVFGTFRPLLNGLLILGALAFSWRVYKSNIRYGWI